MEKLNFQSHFTVASPCDVFHGVNPTPTANLADEIFVFLHKIGSILADISPDGSATPELSVVLVLGYEHPVSSLTR